MIPRWLAAVFVLNSLCVSAAQAAAPQEQQFKSLDGTPIKAWLFQPEPKPGAQPVSTQAASAQVPGEKRATVVAMHGCGGLYASAGPRKGLLNARHQMAADALTAQGYAVIFPDSLTPRGVSSICAVRGRLRTVAQPERRADALAALQWVRAQPWADPTRVALLGWSHGGSAVLSSTDANQRDVKSIAPFKTAIAFYPGCGEAVRALYRPAAPLHMFLGADDDWTPPGPCVDLATHLQRLAQAGQSLPVQFTLYPGAVHGFDDVGDRPPRERTDVPSRLHPGKGVMVGPNPAAREAAWARVAEVLREALGPVSLSNATNPAPKP